MNLIDRYINSTFPARRIVAGMLLKISKCTVITVEDGTIVKVTDAGTTCFDHDCEDDPINSDCCRRDIKVALLDNEHVETAACYCTLHTLDNKLIVSNREHKWRNAV